MLRRSSWLATSVTRHLRYAATTAIATQAGGRLAANPEHITDLSPKSLDEATNHRATQHVNIAERQALLEQQLLKPSKAASKKPREARAPRSADGEGDGDGRREMEDTSSLIQSAKPKKGRKRKEQLAIIPRLQPLIDQKHNDLPSFLTYSTNTNANTTSTVYRGTHYEYTVSQALSTLNFALRRIGRASDLGIDLVGHWSLPSERKQSDHSLPVLVQCKAAKPTPSMVRELEGTYAGAPAGWRGTGVLALLASIQPSTKGVQAAIQRSASPLGVLQVTREGEVKQFLWNAAAAAAGLEGLGVAVKYAAKRGGLVGGVEEGVGEAIGCTIGLTWLGKPWKPAMVSEATVTTFG
ncbi:hypothetical protein LTR62_004318 [Meristemomyces frigidus]|uniref:Required for respiratory growth protein 7, mitochondrial n=1 Tax=Meristemomyces frigidus TaxID=1508187 RepID=A0AAN7TET3_9PEZI|nr:hypothetical protein LTR62_004318 [Meristemomyces frigidus]